MKPPRDLKRISELLEAVETAWKRWPQLRLTQLINNCSSKDDAYYMKDDVLLQKLKEIYGVPEMKPKGKLRLPRAPLPRQTGGPHRVKKQTNPRKAKHKKTLELLNHYELPCELP